ncbi:MAG: cytochrome c3 family protein [Deltaproteobacteria bacterium]|nr:cytochrome c3 family protein [Deltaproteobacteria bacterium]
MKTRNRAKIFQKRLKKSCLLFLASCLLLLTAGYLVRAATVIDPNVPGVTGTKHNLSMYGPGTIKATSTTEVCIFCHTPHSSNPGNPLWNKQDPGSTYTLYGTTTMTATSIGQPTGASRFCLSCHDGTIAIGSLLNAPGAVLANTLNMQGVTAEGYIPASSSANLSTNLSNDHPISFSYSSSYPANSEIKYPGAPSNYPNIAPAVLDKNGDIQCTSCHDPHSKTYAKFLREDIEPGVVAGASNYGATQCNRCHDKKYWNNTDAPTHREDDAYLWTGIVGTDPNPWEPHDLNQSGYTDDTLKRHGCLSCHRSHGGVAGKYLLKGKNPADLTTIVDEEWTCLNCHNGKMGYGSNTIKNIDTVLGYLYKHDPKATVDKHTPQRFATGTPPVREETFINNNNSRHAECVDCHNPHAAKQGNHAIGGRQADAPRGSYIGNNLIGAWGVQPGSVTLWGSVTPGSPNSQSNYITRLLDTDASNPNYTNRYESFLCLKCHSSYAYGTINPSVPSNTAFYQSDTTADFNTGNFSYHPAFETQGKNQPSSAANTNWPANNLGLSNTFKCAVDANCPEAGQSGGIGHTSLITCSDCHGNSNYGSTDPKGPHGSNNKFLLRGKETVGGSSTNLCYNCHRRDVYGDEGYCPPNANYSRVSHPPDQGACSGSPTSPFYTASAGLGNNSNIFGILCLSCHGGAAKSQNSLTVFDGVHGSNTGLGANGTTQLGKRMMNGACITGYQADATSDLKLWFKTATDTVCNYAYPAGSTPVTITPNYSYLP